MTKKNRSGGSSPQKNNTLKVVILCGAGISVNCGIPDWRGEGGIFQKKETRDVFNLHFLLTKPKEFYNFTKTVFLPVLEGKIKPSVTHQFFVFLEKKGVLQRVYTQNVDTLERVAGLSENKVVEAHGSFARALCTSPTCFKRLSEDAVKEYWDVVKRDEIPRCSTCQSVVRPDVVFFGEGLPSEFHDLSHKDLTSCDLVIVLGTSLIVYPFASLVNKVPLLAPRLLINKTKSGPFKSLGAISQSTLSQHNYRDVVFEGDCDEGVLQFLEALGWRDEFNLFLKERST